MDNLLGMFSCGAEALVVAVVPVKGAVFQMSKTRKK